MSDGFAEKEPRLPLFSKSRIYRIHQIAARGKPAIGDGVLWTTCKRGEAEAQLGDSEARAVSLGGSVVARIHRYGLTWHETNKKSRYGGDVRADALTWV